MSSVLILGIDPGLIRCGWGVIASEGSRPRLPWSFQLKNLIADPSPTGPILEALKADPSLYVRKSVANHLNDIGKDHPDLLVERVSGWDLSDRHAAWIARHALRTLIKKGDARALALIGTTGKAEIKVEAFAVEPDRIKLGERITTKARLTSMSKAANSCSCWLAAGTMPASTVSR